MAVRAPSDSVGAQLAQMRRRSRKTCANDECGRRFEGLAITTYCSDECRFRAAYLRRTKKNRK